jgi:hypothetical protein
MLGAVDLFAARSSLSWQRTGVFLIRGRASLDGGNLLAEGRFAVWGDAGEGLIRGDFCGPDGRPAVSIRGDSTGMAVYYPRDGEACFFEAGLPMGRGSLPVEDLLFFLRTGIPVLLPQAEIVDGCAVVDGEAGWLFLAGGDTVQTSLRGGLFPEFTRWPGGHAEITGSTPVDEWRAWPGAWRIEIGSTRIRAEVSSVEDPGMAQPAVWNLEIPVNIDTLDALPRVEPAWDIQAR